MATKKPPAKPAKATPSRAKPASKAKAPVKAVKPAKAVPVKHVAEKKSVSGQNGGARPGAGRKKGSHNKKTQALIAAVESTGLTPLEYMLQVMRNEKNDMPTRMDAAKSAAPYVHAKLASIEHGGKDGNPIQVQIIDFSALHKPKA